MSKAILTFDVPYCCNDCPFCYKETDMPMGNLTYKKLYRCKKESDVDYDEQEDFDPYVNGYMFKGGRPDWCTLRVLSDEEERKINDILGEGSEHYYYMG